MYWDRFMVYGGNVNVLGLISSNVRNVLGLAFTRTHYKGHPYTKHCICCLPLHIYWIYYYYFSFSFIIFLLLILFFFLSPINAINSNQLYILIIIVIVLLLWGVVIDKMKVVVVVISGDENVFWLKSVYFKWKMHVCTSFQYIPFISSLFGDLQQVGWFLLVLLFPPPIKLTATIYLKYCWKWC